MLLRHVVVDRYVSFSLFFLTQAWIYQYFPMFRPGMVTRGWTPDMPSAARWRPTAVMRRDDDRLMDLRVRLDSLTASQVCV